MADASSTLMDIEHTYGKDLLKESVPTRGLGA